MHQLNKWIVMCACLAISHGGLGQINDTLPAVTISDSITRPLDASFSYLIEQDEQFVGTSPESLDQLLLKKTSVHIKSYGPGLLSSPSFRGGDANHTIISLNGVKLNSPMLGSNDFSIMPTKMFSRIAVFSGVSSNVLGSGGMGGGFNLINDPIAVKRNMRLTLSNGSFGATSLESEASLPFSIAGRSMSASVYWEQFHALNNFNYTDIYHTPYTEQTLMHSNLSRQNMMVALNASLNPKWHATYMVWQSSNARQLPNPISSIVPSEQFQGDTALRMQTKLVYKLNKALRFTLTNHYENNTNFYSDVRTGISNSNHFYNFQSILNVDFSVGRQLNLSIQTNPSWTEASSENYNGFMNEFRWSNMIQGRAMLLRKRVTLEAGTRFEVNGSNQAVLPFGGISIRVVKDRPIHVIGSVAQTARFPTMNELFWNPGGNSDLIPEHGQMAELGFKVETKKLDLKTVYYRGFYENRIRWVSNGSIFSPINIATTQVEGVDVHIDVNIPLRKYKINPYLNLAFLKSLGKFTQAGPRYALSYAPNLQGSAGCDISMSDYSMSYWFTHTGQRFISNDESAYLPSYVLSNLQLAWGQDGLPVSVELGIYNLFDKEYQNLPWRPMPGRSYQISISLLLK